MSCDHHVFEAEARVGRLTDFEGGPVTGYSVDLRVRCVECGAPFQFVGLPPGSHPAEPRCSIDATEARLPIAPAGTAASPLDLLHHATRGGKLDS